MVVREASRRGGFGSVAAGGGRGRSFARDGVRAWRVLCDARDGRGVAGPDGQ